MPLDATTEQKLLEYVREVFKNDSWDYNHTRATVKYAKILAAKENYDERILATTMYLHDVGYAELINNNYSLNERIEAKKRHMEVGAQKARALLPTLGYSAKEIEEITHLISVHDKLEELTQKNELLVLEADSLGQIDPAVGSNFGEEEFARYVSIFERRRYPKFFSETGKELLKKLAHENKAFWKYTTLFKTSEKMK